MPTTSPLPSLTKHQIHGFPRPDFELYVGDLVMWDGKPHEHCYFRHGMIYRVVNKIPPDGTMTYSIARYKFVPVFDFTNPVGQSLDSFEYSTTRNLKRLSLLDLGTLRLHFDNFIREWAKQEGMDVDDTQ